MLALEGVAAGYGDVLAVRSMSLEVRPGECVALIGANGAGKTTTLRAITGLLPLRGGRVLFEGRSLAGLDPRQIVALGSAHVPEGRQVFPSLTVLENLEMGARTPDARAGATREPGGGVRPLPAAGGARAQVAGTLSGRRAADAGHRPGSMARPRLLLLDEPSLGLAPLAVRELWKSSRRSIDAGLQFFSWSKTCGVRSGCATAATSSRTAPWTLVGSREELLRSDHVRQAYLGM